MLAALKRTAKRSKTLLVAYGIVDNWRAKRRFAAGNIVTLSGATHLAKPISESLDYIERVFQDYLAYSGLSPETLQGKRVLEIGPGDNLGVALKFLAASAAQVVCLDRFFSARDVEHQRAIYLALRAQLREDEQARFDEAIDLADGARMNPDRLVERYGIGVEEADAHFSPHSFDYIISRAVLEHLYDTDAAFRAMDRLLAPGGMMIHKVDLSDHGMFSENGMHPLTFLTIPERLYRLMTRDCGKPNRRLLPYYRRKMAELGYDATILVTHLVGMDGEITPHKAHIVPGVDYPENLRSLVTEIRPKLRGEFREMSDDDLLVSGIFLVARKPE